MLINGHSDLETLRRPPTINGVEQLLPTKRSEGWSVKHVRFGLPSLRLGYARDATNSYFVFRTLRERGLLPADLRFRPLSRWSTVSSGRCTSRARRYREGPSGIRRSASSRDRTHRAPHSGRHQAGLGPSPSRYYGLHRKTHDLARIDGDHAGNPPSGSNPELVQAVVRAHAWLRLLVDGTHESIESLAHAVDLHPKVVRSRIRLAFLEPATTQEFLRNNQPTFRNLNELAASIELGWSKRVRIPH